MMFDERDEDLRHQWRLLCTPPGIAWSGRTRYAAAMAFHAAGRMDAQTLELFRVLSRLDDEDPLTVLQQTGAGPAFQAAILSARRQD